MDISIRIAGFRCFSYHEPMSFSIKPGITALVGLNDSGKTAVLQAFNLCSDGYHSLLRSNAIEIKHEIDEADVRQPVEGDLHGHFSIESNDDIQVIKMSNDAADRKWLKFSRTSQANPIEDPQRLCLYLGAARHLDGAGCLYNGIYVGQQLASQWRAFKGSGSPSNWAETIVIEKCIAQILGITRVRIDADSNGKSLILYYDDDRAVALNRAGAGITQIITCVINTAWAKPNFILLDEPEISLHPKLQVRFIEMLSQFATDGVVIATHSLGLASTVADITYSVTFDTQGSQLRQWENLDARDLATALGELNYRAFSQNGEVPVVLVEGHSELKAVRAIMRKVGIPEPFAIISVGGGLGKNMISQIEAVRPIAKHIVAIFDSERTEAEAPLDEKHQEVKKLFDDANVPVHFTERCAIENYFPQEVLDKVHRSGVVALGPFDPPSKWGRSIKNNNYRVVDEMSSDDWKATDVGDFLLGELKQVKNGH